MFPTIAFSKLVLPKQETVKCNIFGNRSAYLVCKKPYCDVKDSPQKGCLFSDIAVEEEVVGGDTGNNNDGNTGGTDPTDGGDVIDRITKSVNITIGNTICVLTCQGDPK